MLRTLFTGALERWRSFRLFGGRLSVRRRQPVTVRDLAADSQGAFWVTLLFAIALQVVAYLLAPKPKRDKGPEVEDLKDPTTDAGRPRPVPFGTIKIQSPNVMWFGDKRRHTFKISA